MNALITYIDKWEFLYMYDYFLRHVNVLSIFIPIDQEGNIRIFEYICQM